MSFTKNLGHGVTGGIVAAMVLALSFVACSSDSSEDGVAESEVNAVWRVSGSDECTASGSETDLYIDITAPTGTSYTITVEDGYDWCWTSRIHQSATKTDVMMANTQSDKIYLAENSTSAVRTACISVIFESGNKVYLQLLQNEGDVSEPFHRNWAELPVCDDPEEGFLVVPHYAHLSADVLVRNYTAYFDTQSGIARWVAYPLHDCYMQGTYSRYPNFLFDPAVPSEYQANLTLGSYTQLYGPTNSDIRGHQCMSNHRYVPYSTEMNMQTFYSTNIFPQNSGFNGGLWGSMESVCSAYRCSDTLYCVTGNHGFREWATDKAGKKIVAPQYAWKVLLRTRSGKTGKSIDQITDASQLICIGYWATNDAAGNTGKLKDYLVSVAEIEKLTGYSFFPMLDESIADEVKAQCTPSDFGIN